MSVKHFCDVTSLRITRDGATTSLYKADRGGACRWIVKPFSRLQGIPTVTGDGSNYHATATIIGVASADIDRDGQRAWGVSNDEHNILIKRKR